MYNQNLLNIGCEKSEILVEHVNVKMEEKLYLHNVKSTFCKASQSMQAIWMFLVSAMRARSDFTD